MFGRVLRKQSPILVLLGSLLEVFVDCVELLKGDLFFELVEIEDFHLYDAFSTLIGAIGCAVLSLLVYGV